MSEHEPGKSWLASFQFAQYNKDIVNVDRNLKNVSFMKSSRFAKTIFHDVGILKLRLCVRMCPN